MKVALVPHSPGKWMGAGTKGETNRKKQKVKFTKLAKGETNTMNRFVFFYKKSFNQKSPLIYLFCEIIFSGFFHFLLVFAPSQCHVGGF